MTYTAEEGRREILDRLAESIESLGEALAALGEAYELLDETTGDRMEEQLFKPLQSASGLAQRTHAGFAARHGLDAPRVPPAGARSPASGIRALIDDAIESAQGADEMLGDLQDTMLPVEVGDGELRDGLSAVRRAIGEMTRSAPGFLRTLGR